MLETIISECSKQIPVVWPLQQAIAVNPLADLTAESITAICQKLNDELIPNFFDDFAHFFKYYDDGFINDQDLLYTCAKILKNSQQNPPLDYNEIFVLSHLLKDFLLTKDFKQLNLDKTASPILISERIAEQFYNNPMEVVKQECLEYLNCFFHSPQKNTSKNSEVFFKDYFQSKLQKNKLINRHFQNSKISAASIANFVINELNITKTQLENYIAKILWHLKGWIGFLKWQNQNPDNPWFIHHVAIIEVIALWLINEWLFINSHKINNRDFFINDVNQKTSFFNISRCWQKFALNSIMHFSDSNFEHLKVAIQKIDLSNQTFFWIWQSAFEKNRKEALLFDLKANAVKKRTPKSRIKSQWVFCIDVRSESIRRHLESYDYNETFGFAGFFGFALQKQTANEKMTFQCPAILKPNMLVAIEEQQIKIVKEFFKQCKTVFLKAKNSTLSAFALFEILGYWHAFTILMNNFISESFVSSKKLIAQTAMTLDSNALIENLGFENVLYACVGFLKGVGLTENFAEYIVITGHHSITNNNPFQATVDCGACGGNSGKVNAIVAATVLNNPKIRTALRKMSFEIPNETHFVAACHVTSEDRIEWFPEANFSKLESFKQIQRDATRACEKLQKERNQFRNTLGLEKIKSLHWAELLPDLGLINNAVMIVGPRSKTKSLEFANDVFLHSYDEKQDPKGEVLTAIFKGPVLVAHWINMQYFFSSLAPEEFSSGNKALHNVLPNVGVMEGNLSDLKYGLPQQSLFYQNKLLHNPRRLLVIVYAKKSIVKNFIDNHPEIAQLIDGEWITLEIIEEN